MEKEKIKVWTFDILRSVLISLLVSTILLLILSVIATFTQISDKAVVIINQIIKIISLPIGCIVGIKSDKRGLVLGLIIGILYVVLSFGVFALISGKAEFNAIALYDFLIGIASGLFSGVLAVNLRSMKSGNVKARRRVKFRNKRVKA